MNNIERYGDTEEVARISMETLLSGVNTALIATIESVDFDKLTCTAQPVIMAKHQTNDGKINDVALPILLDVPIVFMRGGGCTLTFPIKKGDECLIVFSQRCIDSWWQSGGVQTQAEMRSHDLSDGIAIVGLFSQVTKISDVSSDAVQLRSDDGKAYVELNPNSHNIKIKTTATVDVTAKMVNIDATTINTKGVLNHTGDLNVTGQVKDATGTMQAMRDKYNAHTNLPAQGFAIKPSDAMT